MAGARKYTAEQELKAMMLKSRGATNSEIVAVTGMPERTVRAKIQKFKEIFKQLENVDDFEIARQRILSASELELLKSMMSKKRLDNAKLGDIAKSFHVVHNAGRLAKGLSTANVETHRFTEISNSSDFNK